MSPDANILVWVRANSAPILIGVAVLWAVIVALIFFSEPGETESHLKLSRSTRRQLEKQREEIQRGRQGELTDPGEWQRNISGHDQQDV